MAHLAFLLRMHLALEPLQLVHEYHTCFPEVSIPLAPGQMTPLFTHRLHVNFSGRILLVSVNSCSQI